MTQPSTPVRTTAARRRPHVVVVGGGFGGLTTVKALAKSDVDITLVDRHTYNAFQPLLYQVATAGLNPGDVTFFLRATRMAQKNVSFRQGEVTGIDTAEQRITFHDGGAMEYDYLVIASGATTNYFGTKGAEENSRAIYTRGSGAEAAGRDLHQPRARRGLEHQRGPRDRGRRCRADRRGDGRCAGRTAQ